MVRAIDMEAIKFFERFLAPQFTPNNPPTP